MSVFRPLKGLFFLVLVLVAAIAVFVLTFDANRYKPDLAALVKAKTGRDLSINGDIQLSLYPNLALRLQQVSLGNAAGFSGEAFAKAEQARVSVQVLPLLQQQLRVNEVTLQGMTLHLQRNKAGNTNWADLLPGNAQQSDDPVGQVIARLLGNFMVAGISVNDSTIQWHDAQSGQTLSLAPLNLQTGALRPGKPVAIRFATHLQQNTPLLDATLEGTTTAQLAQNQQDFSLTALQLQAQLRHKPAQGDTLGLTLSAAVDGNLQTKALAFNGLVAHVDLSSKAQGKLQADVKGTLRGETAAQQYFMPDLQAQVQLPQGKVQLSGRLQANLAQETLSIAGLHLQAGLNHPQAGQVDSNLTADMHWDMASQLIKLDAMQAHAKTQGGQAPLQTADVQASGSTRLQLAQQQLTVGGLKLTTQLQGDGIPGGQLRQQGQGEVNLNWGTGKGKLELFQTQLTLMGQQLNGKLLLRDPLAALAMEGEFKADTLNYPPFQLQKATLGVQMANGVLTLAPQGTLFKGAYQGTIKLNTQQTPVSLQMTHKTSGLRTEELFFALNNDKTITGALNLTANLSSVAGDALAFKQNLNGTLDVALKDGTIRDSNLAQKTQQVVKLFEKERTNEAGAKEVAFTTLGGQWQVQRGIFHTDENVLLAPHFQIKGSGDVNVVNESLDVKLRISEKPKADQPEGLFAPLRVHGAWSNLSYALELDILLKALAQRELDKEKAKLTEKLEAEKQKQLDALKAKADAEKAKLEQRLTDEKAKLEQRLQDKVQQHLGTGGGATDPNAPSVEEQLKQKVEDELKQKLKGLF